MKKVNVNDENINIYTEEEFIELAEKYIEDVVLELSDYSMYMLSSDNRKRYFIRTQNDEDFNIVYIEINADRFCDYLSKWVKYEDEDYIEENLNRLYDEIFDN